MRPAGLSGPPNAAAFPGDAAQRLRLGLCGASHTHCPSLIGFLHWELPALCRAQGPPLRVRSMTGQPGSRHGRRRTHQPAGRRCQWPCAAGWPCTAGCPCTARRTCIARGAVALPCLRPAWPPMVVSCRGRPGGVTCGGLPAPARPRTHSCTPPVSPRRLGRGRGYCPWARHITCLSAPREPCVLSACPSCSFGMHRLS